MQLHNIKNEKEIHCKKCNKLIDVRTFKKNTITRCPNCKCEIAIIIYQPKHKFRAKPTELNGIKFPSKKEKNYYSALKLRQKAGEVIFFLRQIPFYLPGKVKYICDFMEFWSDGTVHFIDVKGHRTPMYKTKKKMVEALYPIIIEEK